MEAEAAFKRLDAALAVLREHFDHVQILATWNDPNGETHCANRGYGNWYARQGMAHEFVNADVAQENAKQIADELRNSDED